MTTNETEHESDVGQNSNQPDKRADGRDRLELDTSGNYTCAWCGFMMGDMMFSRMDVPIGYIKPSLFHNQDPRANEMVGAPLCEECHEESIEMAKNEETPVKEFDLENCKPETDIPGRQPVLDALQVLKNQDQPWAVEGKIDNARRTIVTAIAYGDVHL